MYVFAHKTTHFENKYMSKNKHMRKLSCGWVGAEEVELGEKRRRKETEKERALSTSVMTGDKHDKPSPEKFIFSLLIFFLSFLQDTLVFIAEIFMKLVR